MKASTEIALMREVVGEKIVGRQLECGRTAFQLYIYDDDAYKVGSYSYSHNKCTCT